jgi:hypothetical protein
MSVNVSFATSAHDHGSSSSAAAKVMMMFCTYHIGVLSAGVLLVVPGREILYALL